MSLKPGLDPSGHRRIHGKSELVKVEKTKSGRTTVTGNSSKLRDSAHYPLQFGLTVANLIMPEGAPDACADWVWGVLITGFQSQS